MKTLLTSHPQGFLSRSQGQRPDLILGELGSLVHSGTEWSGNVVGKQSAVGPLSVRVTSVLAGRLSWLERCPVRRKVAGSITGQGTDLD